MVFSGVSRPNEAGEAMVNRCKCSHADEVHRMEGTRAADACAECECKRWRECQHESSEKQRALFGPDELVCSQCGEVLGCET